LDKVPADLFVFVREKRRQGKAGMAEQELNQDYLLALAYAAGGKLQPKRIRVKPVQSIPAETIEQQYVGFGEKYIALRYLAPILSQRDIKRLDKIEAACNNNRTVSKADIEWMVKLHARVIRSYLNAVEFKKLFPKRGEWERFPDFLDLRIADASVRDVFYHPNDYRGKKFYMAFILNLIVKQYAPAVGFEVGELNLQPGRLPPQKGELTTPQLAALIGCDPGTLHNSLARENDNRLDPYIFPHTRIIYGQKTRVFDEGRVQQDIRALKEAFDKGGRRLPPQAGELTVPHLATLIGCDNSGIYNSLAQERDKRLKPYILPEDRFVNGHKTRVFDERKVQQDLEALKDAFGKGKKRFGLQPGELTLKGLVDLIGCDYNTAVTAFHTERDDRLTPYFLRLASFGMRDRPVFDEAKVRGDLASLKEVFGKGGERLPPQKGELTLKDLADLLGCSLMALYNSRSKNDDDRLAPYFLRYASHGKRDRPVFDEAKVRGDLASLKEAFGKGGKRLPPQKGELTFDSLAVLVGCNSAALRWAHKKKGDSRVASYVLPHIRVVAGFDAVVFDEVKVMRDLEQLKEDFGKGGKRLPPQKGEITSSMLIDRLGCVSSTFYRSLAREGDDRLTPYVLPDVRIVQGQDTFVFDEAKVMRDLEDLKHKFGKA